MQNLSASDLASLDAGFHTAREEGGEEEEDRFGGKDQPGEHHQASNETQIPSRNKNNAGRLFGSEDASKEKVVSKDVGCLRDYYSDHLEASSHQLDRERTIWSDSSSTNRSLTKQLNLLRQQALASSDIDPELAGIAQVNVGVNEFGVNNGEAATTVTMPMRADGGTREARRSSLFEAYHSKLSAAAQECSCDIECDDDHPGPIQITVETSMSFEASVANQRGRLASEREPLEELKSSISRKLKPRSDVTKTVLNEINNILAAPVAPPPSRAGSNSNLEREEAGPERGDETTSVYHRFDAITKSDSLLQLNRPLERSKTKMSSMSELLLGVQHLETGSLSDNSYNLTKLCRSKCLEEKSQFEARFKHWKKSNKIITRVHENPINMHMDCLDRSAKFEASATITTNKSMDQQQRPSAEREKSKQSTFKPPTESGQQRQQHQQLNQYAKHLTHLYKRNPDSMDSNSDFRALLYNIICCLLVQEEHVLATPSVGKMLEVIRSHLHSATKVYSSASSTLITSNMSASLEQDTASGSQHDDEQRKYSADSLSCASSAKSNPDDSEQSETNCDQAGTVLKTDKFRPPIHLAASRSKKSADFRRISSVSYNDQQLINDLCDDYRNAGAPPFADLASQRSGSLTVTSHLSADHSGAKQRNSWSRSPWAYQELSDRPNGTSLVNNGAGSGSSQAHYTSQSSLDQTQTNSNFNATGAVTTTDSNQSDLMNDSGNGTMYEFQIASEFGLGLCRSSPSNLITTQRSASICSDSSIGGLAKFDQISQSATISRRRLSEFKPQQRPSYISSDDYFSSSNNNGKNKHNNKNNNLTSFYDDENSSSLQKYDCMSPACESQSLADCETKSADVAERRSELEWTLNKLINIELKHTWLSSQDTLRRAIRKIGVPNEIRGKVWLILIDQMLGTKYDVKRILVQAKQTIGAEEGGNSEVVLDDETHSILKQIELDVNRTMPGHRLFDENAEGGVKLRRILVAYSIHVNRDIAYCQGFNFIVALLLSVFEGDEEKALSGFICIVDHIFPSKYYFDHYLTGARADQFLLADFICDQLIKNPTTAERKMIEGVTSSITLNWFISLFHGAVPTLTRLTILDHFMLEGVKALFRFTMAILYLAFQVTPPSSCDIFQTIRNTAKDMYDIKLLLSIVAQIKLPKDSYFAIRRSFYMVQSSFNSDQFYMQSLSSEASRSSLSNKPLTVQQPLDTKPPALSLISSARMMGNPNGSAGVSVKNLLRNETSLKQQLLSQPRIRTSANRSKVCIQSLGKLGRSHLRIMDTNSRSNERSLISPLRNCLIMGISNCGKNLIMARQSSRRNYRNFSEQEINFHVHELQSEIFDGFYLEEQSLTIILTHQSEILKVNTRNCCQGSRSLDECTETLMLRESSTLAGHEKVKLRLCTLDSLTNLLWIYVECEDPIRQSSDQTDNSSATKIDQDILKFKSKTSLMTELDEHSNEPVASLMGNKTSSKTSYSRKIIIVDIVTFDLFSAFAIHPNFGVITKLRASLVAFCQLLNPASNQFSTRIVQIGPTGRYEQLLSFSDVVDYMINVPESYKRKYIQQSSIKMAPSHEMSKISTGHRYSTLRRFLTSSISQQQRVDDPQKLESCDRRLSGRANSAGGTLTKYYRSLMKSYSTATDIKEGARESSENKSFETDSDLECSTSEVHDIDSTINVTNRKLIQEAALRSLVASSFGDLRELSETNYIPVNMAFIFRNGKIALFEFTESYAIHTRESQLDRYDYSRVIDVKRNGDDFIVTILTVFDKLIKVVI